MAPFKIYARVYIQQFLLFYCYTVTVALKCPVYRGFKGWQKYFYCHLTVTLPTAGAKVFFVETERKSSAASPSPLRCKAIREVFHDT